MWRFQIHSQIVRVIKFACYKNWNFNGTNWTDLTKFVKKYFFCIVATSLSHFGKYTPHGCFDCQFKKNGRQKWKMFVFRHNSTHSMHTIHTTNTRTTHNISSSVSLDTITSTTITGERQIQQQWPTRVQLFCKSIWSIFFFCDVTTAIRAVAKRTPHHNCW